MGVMAKIILACSQKPLAAFIEAALAGFDVDCRNVFDTAALTVMIDELQPDVILLNSGFPTPGENAALLAELQAGAPVLSICEPSEIVLADDAGEKKPELPDVLMLPFGENYLQQKIEKITGLKLAAKSDLEPDVEKVAAAPEEDLFNDDLQPEESEEKDEDMGKVEAGAVRTFELTEIVEEGLPLDELPDSVAGGSLLTEPGEFAAEAGFADDEVSEKEASSIAADVADLDLDDFSDSLDDLESDFQETLPPESAVVAAAGENRVTTLPEAEPPAVAVVENEVTDLESEFGLSAAETDIKSSEKQPEPVAGDLDALLDDDDFTEVEILENEDSVLAGLKSAGLTPEVEVPAVENEPVEVGKDDNLAEDDLNDYEDLLDGVAAVRDESDADSLAGETAVSETDADSEAEFVEMPRPEEVSPPESTLIVAPPDVAGTDTAVADDTPDIELPEDYIEDEEIMSETSSSELELEPQSELHSPAAPVRTAAAPQPAEPRVFTEPQSLDFSQQIEGMTQEWSKQLLQTTYASMDKMIKAIGDLAPTIVNQVAREVIPPLAEKVIKAEIARLEEQLKLEEGEEEQES